MCMRLCKCNTNSWHYAFSDKNEEVCYHKCSESLGYNVGDEH